MYLLKQPNLKHNRRVCDLEFNLLSFPLLLLQESLCEKREKKNGGPDDIQLMIENNYWR